ncbi:MAG: hypothetical protein ACXQTL_08670 [Methanosarcinales archaeon]
MARRVGYWVRFNGRFGPGHQGKFTKYKWFEPYDDEAAVRHYVEYELSADYRNLSVDWEPVRRPPKKSRDSMIAGHERDIERSQLMIRILQK